MDQDERPEQPFWQAVEKTVREQLSCEHSEVILTRFTCANGTIQYRRQCQKCGQIQGSSALKHQSLRLEERLNAPPFDAKLQQDWWDAQQQIRSEMWEEHRAREAMATEEARHERREEYDEHILSSKWRQMADAVLERDNYLCQGCRRNRASQVHLLTYEHFGDEFLWKLVAVCRDCHDRFHQRGRYAVVQKAEGA